MTSSVTPISGMERSAINSWAVAGACVGVVVGLLVAEATVGSANPEWLFTVTGLVAMPFAALAYLLVSRAYASAGSRGRMALAISGWFMLIFTIVLLVTATGWIFPKAAGA